MTDEQAKEIIKQLDDLLRNSDGYKEFRAYLKAIEIVKEVTGYDE